jgi:CheY-like chemotaxis protein
MAQAEKERAPLPPGQGELLLVVEDEVSIREITQVALEAYGYQVLSAADGTEAVALYAQHGKEIQMVITDMAMPIMDGAATIRALQKMNPAVKVIATSGMDEERMLAEASRAALEAFLQKPFTADRLLRTVAEVLKGGGRGTGVGGRRSARGNDGQKLPGLASVAGGSGCGGECLSAHAGVSQTGSLRINKSDPARGDFYSLQHRRRTHSGTQQRIPSSLVGGTGVSGGTRNPTGDC